MIGSDSEKSEKAATAKQETETMAMEYGSMLLVSYTLSVVGSDAF